MANLKRSIIVFIVLFICYSCRMGYRDFIQYIGVQSITYQNWVSGVRNGGSGYLVTITLNTPLSKHIELLTVQVFDKKAAISQLDSLHYQANCFVTIHTATEAIPAHSLPLKLKKNEALLTYIDKGIKKELIVKNVKELPFNAFPLYN